MNIDQALFETTMDNLFDGVYFLDSNRRIEYWNKAAERITGYRSKEVCGTCCADDLLSHVNDKGENLCKGECPVSKTLADGRVRQARVFLKHKEGHRLPVNIAVAPLRDSENRIIGAIECFREDKTTASVPMPDGAESSSLLLCPITGIGDRRLSEKTLALRMERMRQDKSSLSVFCANIDRFVDANRAFGNQGGDLILKMVARTLASAMKPDDYLGRWGGAIFVGIMPGLKPYELEAALGRFCRLVEQSSKNISGNKITVTLSIGAVFAHHDDTPAGVVDRAMKLMFECKQNGGNQTMFKKD